MGNTVLTVLLLGAAVAIGYLHWNQGRVRKYVLMITEALRRRSDAKRAVVASESGPDFVKQLAGTVADVTGEFEQLERRTESQRRFHDVLSEMNQGLFIANAELEIEFANDALKRLFDISESPVGRPLIEVCREHRLVEVARDAFESRRRMTREINVQGGGQAGDGDLPVKIYEVEAAPFPKSDENCWVMIRDVTQEAMTEQVRKDFVANASHELRTPLTLINGYIETLEDGLIDDREAALKSLGIMRKHGKRLVRIIEDMLTISKLERSSGTLRLEPFDVVECASDVIDHLAALIEEKKATVVLDVPEDSDRSIIGDRFYWDQIFMNLIENALKENERGGLRVSVVFRKNGRSNMVEIKDDGVGIQRSDLPYIFKRFYRGTRHHSKQEIKGTGLGLSIVKRAVEAHGGNISVESAAGVETVFTITMPSEVTAVLER